jgi:DNA modification methylase
VIEPDPVNLKNMKKEDLLKLLQELLGHQVPTTVIYHDKPHTSELHPTMKPVTLIGYLMKNSSRMNNIVLDSFGGSGSTLIAAHQLRRRCYTMDLEPGYCQIMIDRIRALDPDIKVRKLTEEPAQA